VSTATDLWFGASQPATFSSPTRCLTTTYPGSSVPLSPTPSGVRDCEQTHYFAAVMVVVKRLAAADPGRVAARCQRLDLGSVGVSVTVLVKRRLPPAPCVVAIEVGS
jgi:hypothetical protein